MNRLLFTILMLLYAIPCYGQSVWSWQPDGTDGKDSYVKESVSTTNYGESGTIRGGSSTSSNSVHRTYIQFNNWIDNLGSVISIDSCHIILRQAVTAGTYSTWGRIVGSVWYEGEGGSGGMIYAGGNDTLVWDDQPILGSTGVDTLPLQSNGFIQYDAQVYADSILAGQTDYGICFVTDSITGINNVSWKSSDFGTPTDRPKIR